MIEFPDKGDLDAGRISASAVLGSKLLLWSLMDNTEKIAIRP
jgi:hypothetical protein